MCSKILAQTHWNLKRTHKRQHSQGACVRPCCPIRFRPLGARGLRWEPLQPSLLRFMGKGASAQRSHIPGFQHRTKLDLRPQTRTLPLLRIACVEGASTLVGLLDRLMPVTLLIPPRGSQVARHPVTLVCASSSFTVNVQSVTSSSFAPACRNPWSSGRAVWQIRQSSVSTTVSFWCARVPPNLNGLGATPNL